MQSIRLVEDANEITYHSLYVIRAALQRQQGPLPGSVEALRIQKAGVQFGSGGGEVEHGYGAGNNDQGMMVQQQQHHQQYPDTRSESRSRTTDENGKQFQSNSTLASWCYCFKSNSIQTTQEERLELHHNPVSDNHSFTVSSNSINNNLHQFNNNSNANTIPQHQQSQQQQQQHQQQQQQQQQHQQQRGAAGMVQQRNNPQNLGQQRVQQPVQVNSNSSSRGNVPASGNNTQHLASSSNSRGANAVSTFPL